MISSIDIRRLYINLYKELRNYFWDYNFIKLLLELEEVALNKFPDMKKLRNLTDKLYNEAKSARDLQNIFLKFKQLIEENDCAFSYLTLNIKE